MMSYLSERLETDVQLEQQQQQQVEGEEGREGEREDGDVRIDFLMPCHATPWTTHVHVPAFFSSSSSSLPLSLPPGRLLLHHRDCFPTLQGGSSQLPATATDEFLLDPLGYATQRYGEKSSSSSSSSSSSNSSGGVKGASPSLPPSFLPEYIVAFGSAAKEMEKFLVSVKGYQVDATLYHSSFKGDVDSPRHEDSIVVFALGGRSARHRRSSSSSSSSSSSETKEEL